MDRTSWTTVTAFPFSFDTHNATDLFHFPSFTSLHLSHLSLSLSYIYFSNNLIIVVCKFVELKDHTDRVRKEGCSSVKSVRYVRGFTGWRSTWPLSTTNYQWPRTLAIWSEVCRGAEVLVRRVVSRSFWGWTRGIRPVSQSVTMHPGREIVPERGDTGMENSASRR